MVAPRNLNRSPLRWARRFWVSVLGDPHWFLWLVARRTASFCFKRFPEFALLPFFSFCLRGDECARGWNTASTSRATWKHVFSGAWIPFPSIWIAIWCSCCPLFECVKSRWTGGQVWKTTSKAMESRGYQSQLRAFKEPTIPKAASCRALKLSFIVW